MITEDYVSFEIAKLLKKKGFNGAVHSDYNELGGIIMGGGPITKNCVKAPTLQMAMKWLREEHNIDIDIYTLWKIDREAIYRTNGYKFRLHYANAPVHSINKIYPTYEKACEAAIKYCLEILI